MPQPEVRITSRLIDSLYTEAMLLADEARSYFDDAGRGGRAGLQPFARVGFACESLKVTTRIMHIVAWLLTQRAIESGEIPLREGRRPDRRLGNAQDSDPLVVRTLPPAAQKLISSGRSRSAATVLPAVRISSLNRMKAWSVAWLSAGDGAGACLSLPPMSNR